MVDYYKQFNNILKVIITCGANLGEDDGITQKVLESQGIDPNRAMAKQEEQAEEVGKEWCFALAFLMGSDLTCSGCLLENLENEYTQGHNNCPKT